MEEQLKRDPITGLYFQVPIEDEDDEDDDDDIADIDTSTFIKKEVVLPVKSVLKCKQK